MLQQQAKTLQADRPDDGSTASKQIESIKHLLWHGNVDEALDRINNLFMDLDLLRRQYDRLVRCARLLLDAGADVNQPFVDGEHTLSPLYGAAGKNRNPEMTKLLLDAGANPNDSASLYHSMEEHQRECASLLLEAGAKVEGSNALHHCLD